MTGNTLIYERQQSSAVRWMRLVAIGLGVFPFVIAVVEHSPWRAVWWGFCTLVLIVGSLLRPRTEVSADGIRTSPMRRGLGTRISWDDIQAVVKPGPYDTTVQVIMADGKVRPVVLAVPADAAAIAALGGKELRPRPASQTAKPSDAPPTIAAKAKVEDPALAQARREESVTAEGQRLLAELRRLRGET